MSEIIEVNEPMKLVISITGKSAEDLFAVGCVDLKEYFLPEGLKISQSDIKKIWFEKVTKRYGKDGLPAEYIKHKDNIH